MKAWIVWRQLSWTQRRTLVLALFLLPLFAALLRHAPSASRLLRWNPRSGPAPDALAHAHAAARAVNLVAARLRATCLTRSLVLRWILAGRGIATVLCIGVRNEGGGLQAHAWLECEGVAVNDTPHNVRGFAPLELR